VTHEPFGGGPARVVARLAKQVERALSEVDLSLAQYRLLGNLADGPSLASTLAERLIVSRPSVTALADGLVERGLVARSEGTDRRQVLHVLTPDGQKVVRAADEAIERRLENLADHVSEGERQRAFRGLESWGKALDTYRAKAVKETATPQRSTGA
jgi:long-chain acyl-CoA synthetase